MESMNKRFSWLFSLSLACATISAARGFPSRGDPNDAAEIPVSWARKQYGHTSRTNNLRARSRVSMSGKPSRMGDSFASRVAGGYAAPMSTYVHVAYLDTMSSDRTSSSCTGTIVNSTTILTAAHCFRNSNNKLDVTRVVMRVGRRSNRGRRYTGRSVNIYKKFDLPSLRNDIALVTLSKAISGKEFKAVRFPTCTRCFPKPGQEVFAAGFGMTDNDERSTTNVLLQTPLVVRPFTACRKRYNRLAQASHKVRFGRFRMFCAMDEEFPNVAEAAVCEGDSGGPVFVNEGSAGFVQLGLTSFGSARCKERGAVDWFVNLNRYQNDIKDFLGGRMRRWNNIYTHSET